MNRTSPFAYSYLIWILIFVIAPILLLWLFNFRYFIQQYKVFLWAILGAIIFSFPWDLISIREQIWLFEKPYIAGWWLFGLPIEEWLFIILVTVMFVSVTLIFWKKIGRLKNV
ncbi:MAG: lycopene cyclase domain-containing protein [Candidatus Doudnabacteria bacterium]